MNGMLANKIDKTDEHFIDEYVLNFGKRNNTIFK